MKKKLLSILIPTYNRKEFLIKNLLMLDGYISDLNCIEQVEVIISDNASDDSTYNEVSNLITNLTGKYSIYLQENNIGLEGNAAFCLSMATGIYSMFIGDDDYVDKIYLEKVLKYIQEDNEIKCIVTNFYEINQDGSRVAGTRDKEEEDKIYEKSLSTIKELMIKAHQMTGLTFKTEDTLLEYNKKNLKNLYPFIFFAGFNMQRGKSVHISNNPVRVIRGNFKYWGYGNDGLLNDMFKNIEMISQNIIYRFVLERSFVKAQKWRYKMYKSDSVLFLKSIYSGKNISILFKIYITPIIIINSLYK